MFQNCLQPLLLGPSACSVVTDDLIPLLTVTAAVEGSFARFFSQPRWRQRAAALKHLLPVLHLIWEAAPAVVAGGLALRVVSASVPITVLAISKWIMDLIEGAVKHPGPIPATLWWLLTAIFALAALNSLLSRAIDYTDARLADEFTREVSLRVMRHAARLDLARLEDPAFQDKLERARQQATDRIGMLNSMGRLRAGDHHLDLAFGSGHRLFAVGCSCCWCCAWFRLSRAKATSRSWVTPWRTA